MAFELLQDKEFVIFSTREFALASNKSISTTSRLLHRWQEKGLLQRLTRGIWVNTKHPYFSIYSIVPTLLGREQGYISFLTALHLHGLISQIPRSIQIATTGSPRRLKSVVGTFEFFQIKPQMMRHGIDWSDSQIPYRIASAEKSLLDVFYLSTRKGRRFARLPEIEFPNSFRKKKLHHLVETQIKDDRIKKAVFNKIAGISRFAGVKITPHATD